MKLQAFAKKYWAELGLIFISAFTFLYQLGSLKLFDGDETTYYYVAHNINKTGQWLTLFWRQPPSGPLVPFFDKPPLMYWLQALLIRLPGSFEFWDRLPSALAGVGVVLLVYAIAKRLYDKPTGIVAALVTIATPGLFHIFRIGQLDGPSTFFFWLALYFTLRLKEHPKFYYWLGAAIGLGLMTKGANNLLVIPVIALAWLWQKEFTFHLRNKHLWIAVGIAVAIAAPWHIVETILHGKHFWDIYVGVQLVERTHGVLATPGLTLDQLTPTYYFKLLGALFEPWVYVFPFAFGLALRDTIRGHQNSVLPIVAAVVILGFFSYAGTKLSQYIIPALPALSILVANLLVQAWNGRRLIWWLLWPAGLLVLFFFPFNLRPGHAVIFALLIVAGIALDRFRKVSWPKTLTMATFVILVAAASYEFTAGLHQYLTDYHRVDEPVAILATQASKISPNPVVMYPVDIVYNESLPVIVAVVYADRAVYPAYNLGLLRASTQGKYYPTIVVNDSLHLLTRHFDTKFVSRRGNYSLLLVKWRG